MSLAVVIFQGIPQMHFAANEEVTLPDQECVVERCFSFFSPGWLLKMTIEKPEELESLMDEPAYEKFIESLEE